MQPNLGMFVHIDSCESCLYTDGAFANLNTQLFVLTSAELTSFFVKRG